MLFRSAVALGVVRDRRPGLLVRARAAVALGVVRDRRPGLLVRAGPAAAGCELADDGYDTVKNGTRAECSSLGMMNHETGINGRLNSAIPRFPVQSANHSDTVQFGNADILPVGIKYLYRDFPAGFPATENHFFGKRAVLVVLWIVCAVESYDDIPTGREN